VEELYGWGWTKTFHPDDVEACVGNWRAALASSESFEGEGRVRRADGEYRTLLHHKVPLRDKQGTVVKWYGSSFDIEDRKQAEKRVREQEIELRQMLDLAPQLIFVERTDGRDASPHQPGGARLLRPHPGRMAELGS
jgi:PAS domain-containing protein